MAEPQPTRTPFEEWRDIPGYEGHYQVSDHGRVRSLDRVVQHRNGRKSSIKGRTLKPAIHVAGYPYFSLYINNMPKRRTAHSLVLESFVGPRPNGMEGCHADGEPMNSHVDNLRWDSSSSNNQDRVRHGTHNQKVKTHCPRGHKLGMPNNTKKHASRGYRECLACAKARDFLRRKKGPLPSFVEVADQYYRSIMAEAEAA